MKELTKITLCLIKALRSLRENIFMNKLLILMCFVSFIFMSGCGQLLSYRVEGNIQRLRNAQAKLLENPNDKEALAVMLNILKSYNGIDRGNAAGVLGNTAELSEKVRFSIKDEAIPPLIELLDKGDHFDKRSAVIGIRGFGKYATPAVPVLRKNLFPSENDFAWFSAETLGKIGAPAAVAVPDLIRVIKENLSDDLGYKDIPRRSATRALGEIGLDAREAIPDLIIFLDESKIPRFRIEIAVALIRINPDSKEGLVALESFIQNKDLEIRRQTIWELEFAGVEAKPAINLIKAAHNDTDSSVTFAANQLLEIIDKS